MENNKVLTGSFNNTDNDSNKVIENKVIERTMDKKISVENFCKGVDRLRNIKVADGKENDALNNYIQSHMRYIYVGYGEKCDIAMRINRATCYITVNDGDEEIQIFKQNSPARNMLFVMNMVDLYTDIDIRFKDHILEDFDVLEQRELIDEIIKYIPQGEFDTFSSILDMQLDDIIENERSVAGFMYDTKTSIKKVFDVFKAGFFDEFVKQFNGNGDEIVNYLKSLSE